MVHNNKNTYNEFGVRGWFWLLMVIIVLAFVAYMVHKDTNKSNYEVEHTIYYGYNKPELTAHKNFRLVETFTIPQYNTKRLCKIVDDEYNIVCYINAVGGGIECFKLKDAVMVSKEVSPAELDQIYSEVDIND